MTRFTDRVARDLGQIADRATPSSSTGWEAIRQRLAEQPDQPTTEVIMLSPDRNESPTRTRPLLLVAAAAAAVVLIGGLIVASRGDDDPSPVQQPDPTTAVDPEDQTPAEPEGQASTEPEPANPEPVAPEVAAEPLPFTGATLAAGPYDLTLGDTALLGVPMELTIGDTCLSGKGEGRDCPWTVGRAKSNEVNLDSFGPFGGHQIRAYRVGGWYTRDEAADPEFSEQGSIDPNDIEAWVEANDLIAERRPDVTVGGRTATVYDLRFDPASDLNAGCPADVAPCFFMFSISPESFQPALARDPNLMPTEKFDLRVYLVPIEGFDPVVIWLVNEIDPRLDRAAAMDASVAWFDEVESTVIASIAIGDDAPPRARG